VRIEYRGDYILHDDNQADPFRQPWAAEKQKMRNPHAVKENRAGDTELNCGDEGLIVRIDGGKCRDAGLPYG
jgi:hypothetical protein